MTLADWRIHILLFTVTVFNVSIVNAMPSTRQLKSDDVRQLEHASSQIRLRLKGLSKASLQRLQRLEEDLAAIKEGVAVYFHAPNLRDKNIRPTVLRMRKSLATLLAIPPVLILHHDVLRFAPDVHRDMASAYRALGRVTDAERHERLAQASTRRVPDVPASQKSPLPSQRVTAPNRENGAARSPD